MTRGKEVDIWSESKQIQGHSPPENQKNKSLKESVFESIIIVHSAHDTIDTLAGDMIPG